MEGRFGIGGTARAAFAPYQSCFGCFKGDTTTGLILEGEAEWIIAALGVIGVPEKEVHDFVYGIAEERYGCDPGHVPVADMEIAFRMCADCAGKAHIEVRTLPEVAKYQQPDELRDRR
jgi:hypothetical protein